MQQLDVSTIDLDRGGSATIHTKVHSGDAVLATVDVTILVLEAKDDHLILLVEQDTVTHDVAMGVPSIHSVVAGADDQT